MIGSVSTCRARVDSGDDSWDITSCIARPTHRHGWHGPVPGADTDLIVDADARRRVGDGHAADAAQHGATRARLELGGTDAGHIAGIPRTRETRSHFAADWSSVPTGGHLSSRRTQPWPRCLTGRDSSYSLTTAENPEKFTWSESGDVCRIRLWASRTLSDARLSVKGANLQLSSAPSSATHFHLRCFRAYDVNAAPVPCQRLRLDVLGVPTGVWTRITVEKSASGRVNGP